MVAYPDENLRVAALQSGDVDLIEYVPWQSIDTLAKDPAIRLDMTDGPFMFLIFNGRSGPFRDARVRQAVAFAIRREDIVAAAFFGHATPLGGVPIPKTSPFYNPALAEGWSYDLPRAKRLLAEAGFSAGFSCTLLADSTYGMDQSTAQVVQQSLAAIGIQVKLALPEWASFVTLANRGRYDFAIAGVTSDNTDPDGLTSVLDMTLPAGRLPQYRPGRAGVGGAAGSRKARGRRRETQGVL